MDITGQLKVKFDTQKVSDKFSKREFVLTTEQNTPYPQHLIIQLTQDKCALLDPYAPGDEIKAHINLRGREWNGPQGIKFFNTIEAWKIELVAKGNGNFVTDAQPASQAPASTNTSSTATTTAAPDAPDDDSLPF